MIFVVSMNRLRVGRWTFWFVGFRIRMKGWSF